MPKTKLHLALAVIALFTALGYAIFHHAMRLLGRRAGYLLLWFVVPYYLLVARRMYIEAPERPEPVPIPRLLGVAIGICVLGVVGIGLYPGPWVEATMRVAESLF